VSAVGADCHARAPEIEAAVRHLVGIRFRPQGRDECGLDCLGVVLVAARAAGLEVAGLDALPLRGVAFAEAEQVLRAWGCRAIPPGDARPGDLLMRVPAECQLHFAIVTSAGLVEAHAGLRRVVERCIGSSECWASGWRLPAEEG
jgi:lipoprotein Spr